jgi:hypothetical protein
MTTSHVFVPNTCDYEYVLCCETEEDIQNQVISLEQEYTYESAN